MRESRAVLAALVRLHGWEAVRELVEEMRPKPGQIDRPASRIADEATRIAPPTDIDQARAKRALRKPR